MTTLFIVENEARRTIEVFSDRETAEKYRDLQYNPDLIHIEEVQIDRQRERVEQGLQRYEVTLRPEWGPKVELDFYGEEEVCEHPYSRGTYIARVYAMSEDEALSIARQKIKELGG